MSRALQKYLDRVMIYANRDEEEAARIRTEQEDHLLKKISDLQASGLSREDAVFQAIEEHGHPRTVGYGLRKRFPWIDVRTHGTARGFIAMGPKAIGVFAFGGVAFGVFALGGFALGLFAFGGLALAALLSFGGFSAALIGFAYGGFALGLVALGGFTCGIIATGATAIGLWVPEAVKAVSYFSQETVPHYLQYFDAFLTSKRTGMVSLLVFHCIFFSLLFTMLICQQKERRRIKRADPKLVE